MFVRRSTRNPLHGLIFAVVGIGIIHGGRVIRSSMLERDGATTTGILVGWATGRRGATVLRYQYTVGGHIYMNTANDLPGDHTIGSRFEVRYVQSAPSISQPTGRLASARPEAPDPRMPPIQLKEYQPP